MKSLKEVLNFAKSYLQKNKIENYLFSSESIISYVLKLKRYDLYLFSKKVAQKDFNKISSFLKRRAKGEPLEYILGEVDFFGASFDLTKDVLIPRVETEILVDYIAKKLKKRDLRKKELWDLGSGSGCIGISLKKMFPDLKVTLSDISQKALKIAYKNKIKNKVDLELKKGSFFKPFLGKKADFIIFNPPYISEKEYAGLSKEVKDFEPKCALVSGETGLEAFEKVAKELPFF